jgi:hypothetical protein
MPEQVIWPDQADYGGLAWTRAFSARKAAEKGRGMGHLMISCGSYHDELRTTTFYELPHDIAHRQAGL